MCVVCACVCVCVCVCARARVRARGLADVLSESVQWQTGGNADTAAALNSLH